MINISTQSLFYILYKVLSQTPYFKQVTPFKDFSKTEMNTFNDICTFLRTTLLYLFVSLPLLVGTASFFIFAICKTCISLFAGDLTLLLLFIISIAIIIGGAALLLSVFCLFDKKSYVSKIKHKLIIKFEDENTNSWIVLTCKAIKAKHDKVCKQIKIIKHNDIT